MSLLRFSSLTLFLALGTSACVGDGGDSRLVVERGSKSAAVSDVTVTEGPEVMLLERPLSLSPSVVGRVSGRLALGGDFGLSVLDTGGAELVPAQVQQSEGPPVPTGPIRALTLRGNGSALVAGTSGLFNDGSEVLFRSPLSEQLDTAAVRALSTFGEGEAEELWLLEGDSIRFSAQGTLQRFRLEGAAPLRDLIAVGKHQALLLTDGDLLDLDLTRGTALYEMSRTGEVHGATRLSDGTVYVATEAGLYERSPTGAWRLFRFGSPVTAVSSSSDRLVLALNDRIVLREGDAFLNVATLAQNDGTLQWTSDAEGNLWVVRAGTLTQLLLGQRVSFAKDVAPFFDAHCVSCHAMGIAGAPRYDFSDYAASSSLAGSILRRLRDPSSPMPPRSNEELSPSDYEVVVRWVNGGMLP